MTKKKLALFNLQYKILWKRILKLGTLDGSTSNLGTLMKIEIEFFNQSSPTKEYAVKNQHTFTKRRQINKKQKETSPGRLELPTS